MTEPSEPTPAARAAAEALVNRDARRSGRRVAALVAATLGAIGAMAWGVGALAPERAAAPSTSALIDAPAASLSRDQLLVRDHQHRAELDRLRAELDALRARLRALEGGPASGTGERPADGR